MLGTLPRWVLWLALVPLVYIALLWLQPEPPFRDFAARAEIEYDGKPVTIEGSLRCTRSSTWLPFGHPGIMLLPHGGNYYSWSDVLIAQKLADGSALVIALHPDCHSPSHQNPLSYPDGTYPVVYWLDNADRPNRVEAYFDRSGYESANARLKLKHIEITYAGRSIIPRLHATDAGRAVPWTSEDPEVRRDRATFVAYVAMVVPEEQWRKSPSAVEILSMQDTWGRFADGNGSAERRAFQVLNGFPEADFSLLCRAVRERLPSCDAIRNGLTLDAQDGRFILHKGSSTTGVAIFARQEPQVPGKPRTTRFSLAGHEEQIVGFRRVVFYDPEQRRLLSLKRFNLVW